jgi:hypothetical protein
LFIAQQQRHSEFLFQLADLPAERRLRDMQVVSSFVEVEMLGDGDEVTDVSEFHETGFYNNSPSEHSLLLSVVPRPFLL